MGVWVRRATSSWTYPMPCTRPTGEPNEEPYLRKSMKSTISVGDLIMPNSHTKIQDRYCHGLISDNFRRCEKVHLRVVETFPFFFSEQLTELGISQGHSLQFESVICCYIAMECLGEPRKDTIAALSTHLRLSNPILWIVSVIDDVHLWGKWQPIVWCTILLDQICHQY